MTAPTNPETNPDQRAAQVVYGASRVFDLFTLMAITLAFALLFTVLKFLAPAYGGDPIVITLGFSGFVALVGMGQMFLFGGKKPRAASIVSGLLIAMMVALVVPSMMPPRYTSFLGPLFFFFGFLGVWFGYLAGGAVAGVFLIADAMRGRYNQPTGKTTTVGDVRFDEVE